MKKMEFAIFWLPIIGGILLGGLAGAAWYGGNKILGLWLAFFGVVSLLIVATLQIQKGIEDTKSAAARPAATQNASQRAWLTIVPRLTTEIVPGSAINIELVTENVGREPATGVSHHGVTMAFDAPNQLSYAPNLWSPAFAEVIGMECDLAVPIQGRATIFPGNSPVLPVRWDSPQDTQALIDGKKLLVMYGCIGYFTMGQQHYTRYCLYLMRDLKSGLWRFGSAPIGNDAN